MIVFSRFIQLFHVAVALLVVSSIVVVVVVDAELPSNVDPAVAYSIVYPDWDPSFLEDKSLYAAPNAHLDAGAPPTRKQISDIIKKFDDWLAADVPDQYHLTRIVPSNNDSLDDRRYGRYLSYVPRRTLVKNDHIVLQPVKKLLGYLPLCQDDTVRNETDRPADICAFVKFARELFRDSGFYPEGGAQAFDADPLAVTQSQLMEIALLLVHIRFADKTEFVHAAEEYFRPYIDALPFEADVPLCSFDERDLEIFPAARHLLRLRAEIMRYHYRFLVDKVLPHFPGVFGGEDAAETARTVLTPARYMWAYCLAKSRSDAYMHGNGQKVLVPPVDFIASARINEHNDPKYKDPFDRSIRWPPKAPAWNQTSFHVRVLRSTVEAGKQLTFPRFDESTTITSLYLIEFNHLDSSPRYLCANVDLPMPSDSLWTSCIADLFDDVGGLGDRPFAYERKRLMHQACIKESQLTAVLNRAERHYVYNKTCTVWSYQHGKYQRRNTQTRFDTVRFFSVLVRGQLKRVQEKVRMMEKMLEEHKKKKKDDGGEQQQQLPPHFDIIFTYSSQQRQLLARIRGILSTMAADLRKKLERQEEEEAAIRREEEELRRQMEEQQKREKEERQRILKQQAKNLFAGEDGEEESEDDGEENDIEKSSPYDVKTSTKSQEEQVVSSDD